jgi:hypothetical protein
MSVRTVFESNSVDYLLPPAGGNGSVMAIGAGGDPAFGEVFTTTCNVDFTNPVLDGVTLTLQQIGIRVDVFLHGKPLQLTIPGSNPTYGTLVTFAEPMPESLIPVNSAGLGCVAFQGTGGPGLIITQATIAGASTATPGQIAFVYSPGIAAGTYRIGNWASTQFASSSVYLGSYLLA